MINIDNRHPVQPELLAQLGQKQVDRIVQAFCLAQQFQRQISQVLRPGEPKLSIVFNKCESGYNCVNITPSSLDVSR